MGKIRLVFGVGINDADYNIERRVGKKRVWWCPYHTRWINMLKRCYYKKYLESRPTYKGCSVCEGWLLFSTFKKWMEQQDWEDRALDKDFLIGGNKIYSPDTCVFIPLEINNFITTRAAKRGEYPLGVYYRKKNKDMVNERSKPYMSRVGNQGGKADYLGVFETPEEAHQAYLKVKLEQCVDYIEEFKGEPLIVKGLERVRDKIQYHIDNNLELTSF